MYTSIWIRTNLAMDTILPNIQHWLDCHKHAILPRRIQCQSTYTVGWLVYLDGDIDCIALATEIAHWVDFEVECRWCVISIGKKGSMTKAERVQAIHLIVDDRKRDEADEIFRDLYSTKSTVSLLGSKCGWSLR
ncbi:hypothetical protein ACA910_009594 [Epithemia clementina (nom. ined.)]